MAKQLLLIRHGKSDWANSSLKDFDRPLNNRGKANAPEMAQRMVGQSLIPDFLISSPALRAFTTAKYFAKGWGIDETAIETDKSIYEAGLKDLLKLVNNLDNQYDKIAVFGHNPGFTDFANYLSNGHIYNIPTCGIVLLEFPFNEWNSICADTGKVLLFDYPKNGDD